jgi:ferritin-like metal-binding protein YciE
MAIKSLDDLFTHFLKDMYYAEKQVLKSLPGMIRKAETKELRQALEDHRDETEQQIENLEKVFDQMGMRARGVTCQAIDGIIEEAKEIMSEVEGGATRDAGIIGSAQAVEHYEITRYGTLIAWAEKLGKKDAIQLLEANLAQEKAADAKLTKIAEGVVNDMAAA